MATINWNKIKTEYITSDISFRGIVEKYGVSKTAVERRSKKENWIEERGQFKVNLKAKIQEQAGDDEAEAVRVMKERERLEFDKLNNLIWRAISEPKTDIDGTIISGEYQIKQDVSPLDADRIVSAKYKLQTMIYKNYGIADRHEHTGGNGEPLNIEVKLVKSG